MANYKSHLHEMSETTPTDYWNDSCNTDELAHGIEHGAVGATTNPTIVLTVLQQQMGVWRDRIFEIIAGNPTWGEDQVAWQLIEEMAVKGASMLKPVFDRHRGLKGRISIQTNPKNYRDTQALVDQSMHFQTLAPNINVKIPATVAGIEAMEEVTYRGVSVNATVSFTVPQVIAVAEAVASGLKRREAEGHDTGMMAPVATIMVGRVDDWLKILADKHNIITNPDYLEWAGVAVMKNAYRIFRERGYRTRLLAAAYRNHYHWSEFIGGDVIVTIPYKWAVRFNGSDVTVKERMNTPVDPAIVKGLSDKFEDFVKAYEPDGMSSAELDSYGATVRTLRGFVQSYVDLCGVVRDFMLPNPDK
ncbi:MAG: transaldolase family protein [Spirochaetia bacterium]